MAELTQKLANSLNIRKILVFNAVLLFFIKAALPLAGPQLATILEVIVPFNSREIITETNRVRAANNLMPLDPDTKLDLAATQKLNDMLAKNYFAHTSPQGATPWFWIEKSGYNYSYAGENLALGFLEASETISAWMNSPSHRANIINSNYKNIGVATGKANLNGVTGVLIVQMFGKPATAAAPIAASRPIPKESPVETVLLPSPVKTSANNNIAGSETQINNQNSKTEPVKLQYVSTDINIPAVSVPSELTNNPQPSFKLNAVYQIYMAITIALLAGVIILNGLNRRIIMTAAINTFLILISVVVPPITVIAKSVIF